MGRFHCIDSSCATVWVKEVEREKQDLGHIRINEQEYFEVYYRYHTAGDYCLPDLNDAPSQWLQPYQVHYYDVDFEIVGEDKWGRNASFPRIQAKRLLAKWNGSVRLFWYTDETQANSTCNLIPITPNGDTAEWNFYNTQLTIYAGTGGFSRDWVEIYDSTRTLIALVSGELNYLRSAWDNQLGRPYWWWERDPLSVEWLETTGEISEIVKWQAYQVEKLAHLERLEVVPFSYNFDFGGFINLLNPHVDIPRHCLNIYTTSTQSSIISGLFSPGNPSFADETNFIQQVCTDEPGILEPPEYYVVCDCQAECPSGTCSVECGDHICCYNDEGVAIASIPLLNPPL